MNFIQRAVAGMASTVGLQASVGDRNPGSERWWGHLAINSLAGVPVTCETALQLDVVQSVLGRLGGSISSLPMMVFERLGDGKRRPAPEHPLYRRLHSQPNRRQTAQEFRDDQERHLAWYRNCYSIIHPADDGGPVGEIEAVHPDRVLNVERGRDGWVYYTIARLSPEVGWDIWREDFIWHIRKAPLTSDGLRGRPMWETARETFGKAIAVETFGALYFANGGSGGGVLEHPGGFKTKEDKDEFIEAWRSGGSGSNRHKDRLLLHGVKYSRQQVQNDESQFLETVKQYEVKCCRLWNMPPHLVGILDKATFSNIEHQGVEYATHTLSPDIAAWEQSASRDLLVGDDQERFFVEVNVAALLRGDLPSRWRSFAVGRNWGWLSINDVRRLENMDPIGPEGDVYLNPLNMVPAGQEAKELDDADRKPKEGEDDD